MQHDYICKECVSVNHGSIDDMNVGTFNAVCGEMKFTIEHDLVVNDVIVCPVCGSHATYKLPSISNGYVKGYGLRDKSGVHNDMNLHLMTGGGDPYAEHRTNADKADVENKLRKNKEFNSKPKKIY